MFLFLTPREDDPNNVDGVADGYRTLAERHTGNVAHVPAQSPEETREFIVEALRDVGLAAVSHK